MYIPVDDIHDSNHGCNSQCDDYSATDYVGSILFELCIHCVLVLSVIETNGPSVTPSRSMFWFGLFKVQPFQHDWFAVVAFANLALIVNHFAGCDVELVQVDFMFTV